MYGPAHGWISLPLWPGSFAAELPAAGGTPAALAAAARAGSQRPPGPRADRAPRPAPEPRLLPPRPAPSGRAGADAPQRGQPAHAEDGPVPPSPRARVLFLCTGNSARSPMAEALTKHLAPVTVEAFSAGSHPKSLHPNAVRVMREHGIDLSGRRPRQLREFAQQRMDYVVSLCDRVRERVPQLPEDPERIHWSIADPARDGDGDEQTYPAFQQTAAELATRVRFLLHHIQSGPPRQEVAARAER